MPDKDDMSMELSDPNKLKSEIELSERQSLERLAKMLAEEWVEVAPE